MNTNDHFYNTERVNELRIELAKIGNEAFNDEKPGTAQDAVAELRRGINDLSARSIELMNKGDLEGAERLVRVAETGGSVIAHWQKDANKLANERQVAHPGGKGGAVLLKPGESFAQGSAPRGAGQPSLGQIMSAMIGVNKSPDVKAALSEGIGADGGYACPSYLSDEVIDAVRSKSVLVAAGTRTVRLEGKEDSWLRIASDPAVNWHAENDLIPEAQPTFDLVTFQPKTLTCLVKISRECFDDGQNVDTAVQLAIAGAIAQELDKSVLFGSGTNSPKGLINHAGVVEVPVDGALTSYAKLLEALYMLKKNNLWDAPTSWLLSPLAWYQLQGLTSSEKQPLMPPSSVGEIPQQVSTIIPDDKALVGDFDKLMLGFRSDLRVEFLNQAFADRYQYGFLAHVRLDAQPMHPGFFAQLTGIAEASTAKAK